MGGASARSRCEIMFSREFAEQELKRLDLGDLRRNARAVTILADVMANPAGTVTGVYPEGARRTAAFRHLESPYVRPEALEMARNIACAERMAEKDGVYLVVVDKTSILLADRDGKRGFGSVGNRRWGKEGVQVITAMALNGSRVPLGILRQDIWARSETPSPRRIPGHKSRKRKRDPRPAEERESIRWVEVIQEAHDVQLQHAPGARLWFHTDREGDFWGVHKLVAERGLYATVRMNRKRVVREKDAVQPLMDWMRDQTIRGFFELSIPSHNGRPERDAKLSVRFGKAQLRLPVPGKTMWVDKWFVFVDECTRPRAADRIQWVLSTTWPVTDLKTALQVVENYAGRWRIEEFHRTWKSGGCDIEASQLQSFKAFRCWAIFTSSVAARAERLKHESRQQPNAPATVLFTLDEIETMLVWRRETTPGARISYQPGQIPTLEHMTRFVAEMGGFMKSSKVLPGAVCIARGLVRLELLVLGRNLPRGQPD